MPSYEFVCEPGRGSTTNCLIPGQMTDRGSGTAIHINNTSRQLLNLLGILQTRPALASALMLVQVSVSLTETPGVKGPERVNL
jgi:hypothetical protein